MSIFQQAKAMFLLCFVVALVSVVLYSVRVVGEEPDSNEVTSEAIGEDSIPEGQELIISSSNFVVSIERVITPTGRILDTLDVALEAGGNYLAGFDFRIAVESDFVEILKILPGEIMDSCSWEFFSAKPVEPAGREDYPRSVWHVVALAEIIPDETRPACFGFTRPASLVRVVVSSEHVELVPDTTAALYFFWERCSDNSISGIRGDTLSMSDQLYDYFPVSNRENDALFPTRFGAPKHCVDPAAKNRPIRRIDFHNGGIKFELSLLPKVASDSAGGEAPDSL